MEEILKSLHSDALVLDLGGGAGSFDARRHSCRVIVADMRLPRRMDLPFTQCTAGRLPFRSAVFDAVILNHSLEHFEDMEDCLAEIRRIAKPGCLLYVSVPDATTWTDRIYRWLGDGGGHVNPFIDAGALAKQIGVSTGIPHLATRTLHTSLSFLNSRNITTRLPMRMILFANGSERYLRILTYVLRRMDEWLGCRTSIYGWAMFFGSGIIVETKAWTNVCVRCGSGHSADFISDAGLVSRRRVLPAYYRCPSCHAKNLFTEDVE